jgi:hypothetical protein
MREAHHIQQEKKETEYKIGKDMQGVVTVDTQVVQFQIIMNFTNQIELVTHNMTIPSLFLSQPSQNTVIRQHLQTHFCLEPYDMQQMSSQLIV